MTIPSILPAALLTIALATVMSIAFLRSIGARHPAFVALGAIALPLSALVNVAVKRPLIEGLAPSATIDQASLEFVTLATVLWVAPLVEEAAKAAPVLTLSLRRSVSGLGAPLHAGLALGLGFGIGEAGYVAYRIAWRPEYATTEWYLFTGYIAERLTACFIHGVLTAITVERAVRGRGVGRLAGYAVAVILHACANLGPLLFQAGLVDAITGWLLIVPVVLFLAVIWERALRRLGQGDGPIEVLYRRPHTDRS